MPASSPAEVAKTFWYFIAGLLHAALMLLAFPPVGIWACAVLAPVPLIWAARAWSRRVPVTTRQRWFRRLWDRTSGPLWVSLGCVPLHAYAHQWIFSVSELGYLPMVVLMSLFSGMFVWMAARVVWRWPRIGLVVVAPVIWTTLEVFRGEIVATGYPWILIAHPMIDAPHFPGVASLLGTYFAGFLIVVVAGAAVEVVWNRRFVWAGVGVACAGVVVAIWGGPSRPSGAMTPLRVGIVQTNIPQSNKSDWELSRRMLDFQRFCELTRSAASQGSDVIVWPETMFPGLTLTPAGVEEERRAGVSFEVPESVDPNKQVFSTTFHDGLMALSREIKTPMLVGALGFENLRISNGADGKLVFDRTARLNSVFLVSGARVDPTPYNKLELTPFGEDMPYANHWPWLQNLLLGFGGNGAQFDLSAGKRPRAFSVRGVSVVTPICFEATKPGLCRRLVRAVGGEPVVIVNVTNDGWFGSFRAGRLQHMQIARWRCVELGVPMIRAANTGISAAVDASGKLIASGIDGEPGAWNKDGVLTADVVPALSNTLYTRVGDVFGWAVLALGSLATIGSFVGRRAGTTMNS